MSLREALCVFATERKPKKERDETLQLALRSVKGR
jgi:hypothetical protein